MTFQAIAIVLGVNWIFRPQVSDAVLFFVSLGLLVWEERRYTRPTERFQPVEESEEVEFNEDHPDWDL